MMNTDREMASRASKLSKTSNTLNPKEILEEKECQENATLLKQIKLQKMKI